MTFYVMVAYVFMIVLAPFTAVVPLIHSTYLVITKKVIIDKNYWNIGTLLIALWSIVGAFRDKSITSLGGTAMLIGYFSIFIIAQDYFRTRNKINDAFKIIVYCTMLVAFNGIMEKVFFVFIGDPDHRISATFGNPNMTGAWFASVIFVILYLRNIEKTKFESKAYSVAIILTLLCVILTESMGAVMAFIGTILIYTALKLYKKRFGKIIIVIFCALSGISLGILYRIGILQAIIENIIVSFNIRINIWFGSLEMISERPFTGWGMLGTLEHGYWFFPRAGNSIHSHNLWLCLLTTVGIVGFLIFMYMNFRLVKDIFKLLKRRDSMVLLVVALNLVAIIQGLVDVSLYAPQLGILLMVINAIAINLVKGRVTNIDTSKFEEKN